MPNLGLHIGFALECAKRLGHPAVDSYRGSFLLGATSPDMRLFFGWRRDTTHFFELTRDVEGAGCATSSMSTPDWRRRRR